LIEKFGMSEEDASSQATATIEKAIVNEKGYAFPLTGVMAHEGHGNTSEFGAGRDGRTHKGVDIYGIDPETGKMTIGSSAPVNSPIDGKITAINRNARVGYRKGLPSQLVLVEITDKKGFKHRFTFCI
jgi:hypothetical protein